MTTALVLVAITTVLTGLVANDASRRGRGWVAWGVAASGSTRTTTPLGDIVMLRYPLAPEKSFVKRVIGREGDAVRIVDGKVFLNDVPVDDSYVPPEYRSHDTWGPRVIPEGYYFVMGDHRNNSSDSRHWGFVPKKYILGKVRLRWWPPSKAQLF